MKLKIKISLYELNELSFVSSELLKLNNSTKYFNAITLINLNDFHLFVLKKNLTCSDKNKVRLTNICVNQFEALKQIFELFYNEISNYCKAIYLQLNEAAQKQITSKFHLIN